MNRKPIYKWLIRITFVVGFCMSIYPFANSLISQNQQSKIIQTYQSNVSDLSENELRSMRTQVDEYNSMLYQTKGSLVGTINSDILTHENYESLLNISGNGVMGSLEIPKINVDLPIYHGTEDETLSVGVGHVEGTSLPVGGNNTRTILTGHRGLPSSKLFTRLDELVEGDLFYITTLNETMAYLIKTIEVMDPEEAELLEIMPDKDLATLITCTPYGLNTHRLVITGERVTYQKTEKENIVENIPSIRELVFIALPFVFLLIMIISLIIDRKKGERTHE